MAPPRKVPDDADVLALIRRMTRRDKRAPTVRELATEAGLQSASPMHRRLQKLRADGLVTWDEGRARTLRVL